MKLGVLVSLLAALAVASFTSWDRRQRWELPEGKINFKHICASYRAPALGKVPPDGLVPAVSYSVNGASAAEIEGVTIALLNNGFSPAADGYFSINGHWILFAAGKGTLRTQRMADRLYEALCELESTNVRLIHLRYNEISESRRVT